MCVCLLARLLHFNAFSAHQYHIAIKNSEEGFPLLDGDDHNYFFHFAPCLWHKICFFLSLFPYFVFKCMQKVFHHRRSCSFSSPSPPSLHSLFAISIIKLHTSVVPFLGAGFFHRIFFSLLFLLFHLTESSFRVLRFVFFFFYLFFSFFDDFLSIFRY